MLEYRLPHVPGICKRAYAPPVTASLKEKQVLSTHVCHYRNRGQAVQGAELYIEKLDAAEELAVVFDKVIALHNDKALKLGTPFIKGASVEARVLKNGKSKKITVFTYRAKKGSKRKMGHRQPFTKVQIESINAKPARAKADEKADDAE